MIILLSTIAQADVVFPPLTASDLNERSLNLPADFPGKPNIVFIAYKLEQQPNVNAWVEQLDLCETGGQAWAELPVVAARYCFSLFWIMVCVWVFRGMEKFTWQW